MNKKLMKTPVVFISHGSPMVALENDSYTAALENLGKKIEKPRAVVVVSAHWEEHQPIRVTTTEKPPIIYDFGGFPDELYHLTYACPGHPSLGDEIVQLLRAAGLNAVPDVRRGLDHGAWIPLRRLFPAANVPVVQVTLPVPRTPDEIFKIGQTLAPLRAHGVLLMGSGGVVHNLRLLHFGNKAAPVDAWAKNFDEWVNERLLNGDTKSLLAYRRSAPRPDLAVPTTEHFDPLFFALGAGEGEKVTSITDGFHYGNLSMRSFTVGIY
jgi:4,5-DOPA dioxygenase extradiol